MAGPWEKYKAGSQTAGPWSKYAAAPAMQSAAPLMSDMPPDGAKPGSRAYADWAASRARAGKALPQVSSLDPKFAPERNSSMLDPFVQGTTFGWADELRGAVQGGMAALQGKDFGDTYRQVVDQSRNAVDYQRRVNPVGSFAAEFAGAIPTGALAGGQIAGRGATMGARMRTGGAVGIGQGTAYGAGASNSDTLEGRLTDGALGGAIGGGIGALAPVVGTAARRLISPAPASASRKAAADLLKKEGVTLTAGQRTGSKKLQYMESELGGGAADALMERQAEEYTGAILKKIGVQSGRATPEVVDAAYDAIGQQFDSLAAATNTPFDTTLQNNLLQVAADYADTAGTPAPIIERMVNRLGELAKANGGRITGEIYQEVRSTLGRLSKAADPSTRIALRDLQEALDDAIERNVSGAAKKAWQQVRRRYQNFLVVERAVTGAGQNAASGLITPAQLRNAAINQNRRAFARGKNDFTTLANAGVEALTPLPQSGTAPRMAARAIASLPALIGGAAGSAGGIPGMIAGGIAGAALPAITGRAMLSGAGRAILSNQLLASPQAGVVEKLVRSSGPFLAGQRN